MVPRRKHLRDRVLLRTLRSRTELAGRAREHDRDQSQCDGERILVLFRAREHTQPPPDPLVANMFSSFLSFFFFRFVTLTSGHVGGFVWVRD